MGSIKHLPIVIVQDRLVSIDQSLKSIRAIAMFFLALTLLSMGVWVILLVNRV